MAQTAPYRIGIDARFFRSETAGIGRYSRELIHRIAAIDPYNLYFVFLTPADMPEWDIVQPNIISVVVDIPHYSLTEQTKLFSVLYRYRLDLVHFLNYNHPILYRRPFVTTLHDLTVYFHPQGRSQKSRLRRLAFVAVLRRSLFSAAKVIAISEYSALDAEKHLGVPAAKMEIVYEGGPDPVELPFGHRAKVQGYLGIRDPYFIFVSQWRPHKGILTLLDAFAQFKERTGLPHRLVLLGRQKVLLEEVRQKLAASPVADQIVMPGFAPDELLPLLYHNATAHVLPSEYEGFGLTVLEAFAAGTPVIAADNSSLPEVAGSAALFFPTGDVPALSYVMEQLATDSALVANLVTKGAAQLRKFSWDQMARQTLGLYLSVLERKQ